MSRHHAHGRGTAAGVFAAIAASAVLAGIAGGGAALADGLTETSSQPGPGEPSLAAVRAATERFRDVNVALADGALELIAVENLTFMAAWHAAGHDGPPTFHGVPYDTMRDDPATQTDEAHLFEPHYDRHVWIYRPNPNRVFAPINPAVTCEHHRGGEHPPPGHRRLKPA